MALRTQVISKNTVVLTVKDYTGTPNTQAVATLIPLSLDVPRIRIRQRTLVNINTSAGQAPYGYPDHGLVEPITGSLQIYVTDPKNATDAGPFSLFVALANNGVGGTPFSTWIFTNQLTGGGSLMCLFSIAETDTGGTTHTTTCNVAIDSVEPGEVNGVQIATVNFTVLGAIAVA